MKKRTKYTYTRTIQVLKKYQNRKNLAGMARFGMTPDGRLGLSVVTMRKIAKDIGKDHNLALKVYNSGYVEGRIVAALIDEPEKVTKKQMNDWVQKLNSWDDTDQLCMNLFDKTSYALEMIKKWHKSPKEFVKRSAYSLIASLAVHDKNAPNSKFIKLFPIIKKGSSDERNFVKKAVNWALRQIGKRNLKLNKEALKLAYQIKKLDSPSSRWIANDAIRELENKKTIKRLKEKDAKAQRI